MSNPKDVYLYNDLMNDLLDRIDVAICPLCRTAHEISEIAYEGEIPCLGWNCPAILRMDGPDLMVRLDPSVVIANLSRRGGPGPKAAIQRVKGSGETWFHANDLKNLYLLLFLGTPSNLADQHLSDRVRGNHP